MQSVGESSESKMETNIPSATKTSFTSEIQHMMHGFGDVRRPLLESATLVEDIVRDQMTRLLYDATEVCNMRNARLVGIEDFLFLIKKDRSKLYRLLRYIRLKDEKKRFAEEGSADDPKQLLKRTKICRAYLSFIDETGELMALMDDSNPDKVKMQRALRAEQRALVMNQQQYMEFFESRKASFTPNGKTQKFREWLLTGFTSDLKLSIFAVEVLAYLAFETVAQLVDLSLIVKHDVSATIEDPLEQAGPAVCVNPDIVTTALVTRHASINSVPGAVPPSRSSSSSTPCTPTSVPVIGTPISDPDIACLAGKKGKKRKKNDSNSRDFISQRAIQPYEILEAMRRYSQQIGPFANFRKYPCFFVLQQQLLCV